MELAESRCRKHSNELRRPQLVGKKGMECRGGCTAPFCRATLPMATSDDSNAAYHPTWVDKPDRDAMTGELGRRILRHRRSSTLFCTVSVRKLRIWRCGECPRLAEHPWLVVIPMPMTSWLPTLRGLLRQGKPLEEELCVVHVPCDLKSCTAIG